MAKPKVVGTYRLLRQDVANRHGGFYTRGEYDIAPLLPELIPICVPGTRPLLRAQALSEQAHGGAALYGIWTYVLHHRIDVMIGCASLEGTH